MKKINLYYNTSALVLNIPEKVIVDEFAPVIVASPMSYDMFDVLWKKAGGNNLISSDKILFVVNDGYRNTPTAQILKWINKVEPELLKKAHYLVACGTHESPTDRHYEFIFGHYYDELKDHITFHDCHDKIQLKSIGVDHFGEEVFLNRKLFEYDKIVFISSVDPHYFAGLTGGRKSLLPGLADFKTVERNHNLANSLDAKPLQIKGNPVAEHMAEILEMVEKEHFFSIQAIIDADHNLASIFFGDLDKSFRQAVEYAKKVYSHNIEEKYDMVICEITPPLDNNLYQAQKALENSQEAVKDGGMIIIVSACTGGIGSRHFWELADNWDAENNCTQDGSLQFGSHKLYRVNLMQKRIDVRLYSTLPDEQVSHVFYKPAADINELIQSVSDKDGEIKLAIVHNAGHTVLKI